MYEVSSLAVFLLVFIIIGGALINQAKSIHYFYRILIFTIFLNFILSVFSPHISILNLLSIDIFSYTFEDLKKVFTNMCDGNNDWAMRGQIGDLIAGHFTALAFIGILISISQVRKSLEKQDEAIELQRKSVFAQLQEVREQRKETKHAMELQTKIYEKQSFESTFFQLLKVYHEVVNEIEFQDKKNKKALLKYNTLFWNVVEEFNEDNMSYIEFKMITLNFLSDYYEILDHYFRIIYRIIKYIDTYPDEHQVIDKEFYVHLLRAQLSSSEINLIFINGMYGKGLNFKQYCEKYHFLEHLMSTDDMYKLNIEVIAHYDIKAFGNGFFGKRQNQEVVFNTNDIIAKSTLDLEEYAKLVHEYRMKHLK